MNVVWKIERIGREFERLRGEALARDDGAARRALLEAIDRELSGATAGDSIPDGPLRSAVRQPGQVPDWPVEALVGLYGFLVEARVRAGTVS